MAVITVDKVPPYNGEHGLDVANLTLGELARIYDIAGLRPVHLTDALVEEDAKAKVALTVVAVEQAGHVVQWLEPFYAARPRDIIIDFTRGPGVAADEGPPQTPPQPTGNGSGENEKSGFSGAPGRDGGAASSPATAPSDSGDPGSARSAT